MTESNGSEGLEALRIGVYVCWCGSNIAKMVDVEAIAEDLKALPYVVVSRDYKYMCSDPGQEMIAADIAEHGLNRIVVASCSPRIHEITFRRVLENKGVNPYLLEMANIREQCSWVHSNREQATAKARSLISAAIERVVHHEPLDRRTVEVVPATLVIGGGLTGLSAALEIADSGFPVFIAERSHRLGGHLLEKDLVGPGMLLAGALMGPLTERVAGHPRIRTFLDSELTAISGYIGNFKATISSRSGSNGDACEVSVGNIVVATGLQQINSGALSRYGHGSLEGVISSSELERMLAAGKIETVTGRPPRSVVIINCVGCREPGGREYCSRTCCSDSLKYGLQLKAMLPRTPVYVAYTDMRAFEAGAEELYELACSRGVRFMMFDKEDRPRVSREGQWEGAGLLVALNERLSGASIEVPADLVVLNSGVEARGDSKVVAKLVGISTDKDGFFIEKHPKLDPVATTTEGVYIAGRCQGPKGIEDSLAQAGAASARVLASICTGSHQLEAISSVVREEYCAGCQSCVGVCPYGAIRYEEAKRISVVLEALCKGCGTCTSTCPAGAIRSRHFTYRQIVSQIEGILAARGPVEAPFRRPQAVPAMEATDA